MTAQQQLSHNARIIKNIRSVLSVHQDLCPYASGIEVSFQDSALVVQGDLPSADLKSALVAAIRQAGVLCRVNNLVQVRQAA